MLLMTGFVQKEKKNEEKEATEKKGGQWYGLLGRKAL